jgi:hypothetical protein
MHSALTSCRGLKGRWSSSSRKLPGDSGVVAYGMAPVCPATGHAIFQLLGPICPDHGVPWFADCPSCEIMWPLVQPMDDFVESELVSPLPERAHDFCASCGAPGPWLSRPQLMDWV